MPLEIRVLGPLEVLVDGAPLRVDTRKALAIIALLAVERRPYAREELATMLWPEADDESARGALRRTLSVLRTALGGRWLRIDRAMVGLQPAADIEIDLAALEAAAPDATVAGLMASAALARGPFLAGFSLRDSVDFDDWRATRAVTVERRVVDVLHRLATAAEAAGDRVAATDAATRLVELDPLDEPARRRLMRLLAAGGDRAGAIRLYRTTVAILERELGVAPLAETTALYEAIRDERAGAAVPGRATMPAEGSPPPAAPSPAAPVTEAPVPAAPARLPMVGRDAELLALLDAHRAAPVDGRLAVVTGEAGIGKSRLVEALAAEVLLRSGTVLAARAFPAEGSIAYAPIVELLRAGLARDDAPARLAAVPGALLAEAERLVPFPGGLAVATPLPVDHPAARARLLEAVATVVVALLAGPVPGLLVVEDAQWADEASREALLFLARRLAGRPLLLVLTWRPEDLDERGTAFAGAVDGVPPVAVIGLARLGEAEVRALVAEATLGGRAAPDPALLAVESEGLPLYLVEALAGDAATPAGGAPHGMRALLRERLGSVGETAGQVLAAASVIGRSFDLATLRATSGRSEDETIAALEELVRRAIVRETASGGEPAFDFAHARLRDAAYDGVGLARRRLLHARVATVLLAAPAGRDEPGRLAAVARHELAAGHEADAAERFREAGLRARDVYAHREALGHLGTALALGHPDVAGLQVAIGDALTALGDYAGAVAALEAAAAVLPEADLPPIELRLGSVYARRGDVATAASHLDAALAGLGVSDASGHAELRARALVERGAVALRAGHLELAGALAQQALGASAATLDDPAASAGREPAGARRLGAASRLAGLVALRRGDVDTAAMHLARSLVAAAQDDDPGAAIAARNALALVEAAAGRREAAVQLLEEALAECRRTGETHLEAAVENNLADQLYSLGRVEEAMAHLKHAVARFADVGGRPGELEPEIWKLVSW